MEVRTDALERYKLAYQEYRAEVTLGWDRQKLFLTLNPTITTLAGSFARSALAAQVILAAGAATAVLGALVVRRSHSRYQATRAVLLRIEDELGFQDFQTTGGQRIERGNPRLESYRIVDLVAYLFLLNAVLDVLLAVFWK